MYKIVDFVWSKESAGLSNPYVHSFYKTMFMKLNGLEETEAEVYIGKNGAVTYNCDFLYPLVKAVWEKHKNCTTHFYDIRTSEEAGQAAPEYAIMKRAGMKDISPVGIKGMGSMALLLGLQMMELDTVEGECAIMLLAEMEHHLEAQGENIANAFAIYPCKNIKSPEGIWITDYYMHLTADEMREKVKSFEGTVIFSEVELDSIPITCHGTYRSRHGLTEPFMYLHKFAREQKHVEAISVHASGNKYGMVYYQVLGEREGSL